MIGFDPDKLCQDEPRGIVWLDIQIWQILAGRLVISPVKTPPNDPTLAQKLPVGKRGFSARAVPSL